MNRQPQTTPIFMESAWRTRLANGSRRIQALPSFATFGLRVGSLTGSHGGSVLNFLIRRYSSVSSAQVFPLGLTHEPSIQLPWDSLIHTSTDEHLGLTQQQPFDCDHTHRAQTFRLYPHEAPCAHQGDEEVGGVGTHAERHFESPRIISDIIIGFRQVFT